MGRESERERERKSERERERGGGDTSLIMTSGVHSVNSPSPTQSV